MHIKSFDHITINLKDVEKSLWFYGELLGLEALPSVDMGTHLLHYFQLPGGGKLELTEYYDSTGTFSGKATDKGQARHLAFEVEDVYGVERLLTQAGYPFHVPVSHIQQLGFSGGLTRDPNGFELEFVEYVR